MKILITEKPGYNSYSISLIKAYQELGHTVVCDSSNFFSSNFIPDILHIQWPETLYKRYILCDDNMEQQLQIVRNKLDYFRNHNTKIIHTIHNIISHNTTTNIDIKFYKLFIEKADLLIHHCKKSIELTKNQYACAKKKKNIICKHGDFLIDYKSVDKNEAIKLLNIPKEKFVILNFGNQQKYKGIDNINKIFGKLKLKNKYLLNVGNYSYSGYSKLKKELMLLYNFYKEKRTFTHQKFIYKPIKISEIPLVFSAADVVLLGHNAGLNSGVLNMSATFSKPVVFPKIGCFTEQMEGWEHKSYSVNQTSEAVECIEHYAELKRKNEFIFDNRLWLKNNSWNKHVGNILNELEKIS
ncbi:MAG: hypothetical protein CR986_06860 [Ignavibacteriae bacterium]|nr:MAG: hypothetical protein CR986_06860 [Ignavibacteriota bacterium]